MFRDVNGRGAMEMGCGMEREYCRHDIDRMKSERAETASGRRIVQSVDDASSEKEREALWSAMIQSKHDELYRNSKSESSKIASTSMFHQVAFSNSLYLLQRV